MKKKVLFVIPTIWAGGTNSALGSLYNNIDQSRYEIAVLACDYFGGRKVIYENALIKNMPLLAAYYSTGRYSNVAEKLFCYLIKSLKKIIKIFDKNFDQWFNRFIIHRFEKNNRFDTVVAYNEVAVPFVSHFRCENKIAWIHCDYSKYILPDKTEEEFYEKYKTIVTVSEYTTSVFKQFYPCLSDKCKSIYNLLDIARIKECSKQSVDDYRFVTDCFTIVSVGRIVKVKCFREIPKLAKALNQKGCKFRWYIIGPEFDQDEARAIQEGIKNMDVADKVFWLGGKTNPYPYFKNADLYVCTSESEACPMVFIESKVLGTPIVTADFPSAKEFIHQGEDGYIVPIENIPETIYDIVSNNKMEILNLNVSHFTFSNDQLLEQIYTIL